MALVDGQNSIDSLKVILQIIEKYKDYCFYKKENKEVIGEHREVLLQLLPNLYWKDGDPVGYSIDHTGKVHNTNFVPTFE